MDNICDLYDSLINDISEIDKKINNTKKELYEKEDAFYKAKQKLHKLSKQYYIINHINEGEIYERKLLLEKKQVLIKKISKKSTIVMVDGVEKVYENYRLFDFLQLNLEKAISSYRVSKNREKNLKSILS